MLLYFQRPPQIFEFTAFMGVRPLSMGAQLPLAPTWLESCWRPPSCSWFGGLYLTSYWCTPNPSPGPVNYESEKWNEDERGRRSWLMENVFNRGDGGHANDYVDNGWFVAQSVHLQGTRSAEVGVESLFFHVLGLLGIKHWIFMKSNP